MYMYAYVYTCLFIYIYAFIKMHLYINIYKYYINICIYTCICMYKMHVHIYIYMYLYIHVYIYIWMQCGTSKAIITAHNACKTVIMLPEAPMHGYSAPRCQRDGLGNGFIVHVFESFLHGLKHDTNYDTYRMTV